MVLALIDEAVPHHLLDYVGDEVLNTPFPVQIESLHFFLFLHTLGELVQDLTFSTSVLQAM